MEQKSITCLETLYVQVDNTSANKCFTVIVGLAALVALGVCNKVALAFLLVGHTHTDVDRIIGLVVSYIRRLNVTTFEELKAYVLESFTVNVSAFNMFLYTQQIMLFLNLSRSRIKI